MHNALLENLIILANSTFDQIQTLIPSCHHSKYPTWEKQEIEKIKLRHFRLFREYESKPSINSGTLWVESVAIF